MSNSERLSKVNHVSQDVQANHLDFSKAEVSRSALLQSEFRERFNWCDFAAHYRTFLEKHIPEIPGRVEAYVEELTERSDHYAELEYKFADRVIEAYRRWSSEHEAIVLWDVDYTMGANPGSLHSGGSVKEAKWGFRPAFLALIEFLDEKFPEIKNGILSTRSDANLREQLNSPSALGAIRAHIDQNHIYTSYGEHETKPRILKDLRTRINAKSIDDDEELSLAESQLGSGVYFGDCPALEALCVMIAKDRTA